MPTTLQSYSLSMAAGAVMVLWCSGTRFLLSGTNDSLDVRLDIGGDMRGLEDGQGYAGAPFNGLTITNNSGVLVAGTIRISSDEFIDNRVSGTVAIDAPPVAAPVHAAKTVTNASAQMLAAKTTRKYLLIQNNDAAGDIYVRVDGGVATIGTGVKIPPGGSWELSSVLPTGAVTAIGSIASNANVVTVEG